jgi:hypothetical protein
VPLATLRYTQAAARLCPRPEKFAKPDPFLFASRPPPCSDGFDCDLATPSSFLSGDSPMMKMRLMVGLAMVGVAVVSGGFLLGQDKKTDDKDPKATGSLPANYKQLGLTDDQVKKIKTVQASYRAKIDELEQKIKDLRAEVNPAHNPKKTLAL